MSAWLINITHSNITTMSNTLQKALEKAKELFSLIEQPTLELKVKGGKKRNITANFLHVCTLLMKCPNFSGLLF